ncbi:MAG TPA: class I SAM-dependent methyltransferase [Actinophytocola sp.]|uniref:class I SAM-dependent methyltransferase n=1 Tax=Actinophytocola sp. TaxID=1872138 RepID=UPI002DDD35F2|nr:class I SAM-dependent methyltransferase [Actinophytocola sp.]HEV2784187.1 class I SAM-dependent methyltransferase [Actinophytocola sp.]
MPYRLIEGDPEPSAVRWLTFVPFLPDGRCMVLPGPRLPSGEVRAGEHYLLDACIRIPLETVGFRMQRVGPFAADRDHVYAWLDGDRYAGSRPHAVIEPVVDTAEALARVLDAVSAMVVRDGARAFRSQSDADYYATNVRLLEPAYLRGTTVQAGSGFGGDAARWRARREMIVDGIDRAGTFLDVGCANGLLMESVRDWAAERGLAIEPYGVDLAPGLVELARRRLPHWADRIEVGNAIDYVPAGGRRFTFVHVLLDCVPVRRRGDMLRHALDTLVAPGGRLLVSHYQSAGGGDRTAAEHVRDLGFEVAGSSHARGGDRAATTAWIDRPAAMPVAPA